MKICDVYSFLDEKYSFSSALSYDNSGHLIGSLSDKVTGITVCLDCTDDAVTQAIQNGANLIISHHPVIFNPIKSVTDDGIVYRILRAGISVISLHTNFDQADGGLNDILAGKIGLTNVQKVADSEGFLYRIGELEEPLCAEAFAASISEKLNYPVKYSGGNDHIKRVAVCSGSGGSMLNDVSEQGCDAFVTADIKHNVFTDAFTLGISLFDAGHFGTEDIAVEVLADVLKTAFPKISVTENHFSPIKFVNKKDEE